MNLVAFIVSCLALAAPAFAGGMSGGLGNIIGTQDMNFATAYGLSGMLEKTAFSRVIGESLQSAANKTYTLDGFSYPIHDQCMLVAYEILTRYPIKRSAELAHMIGMLKNTSNVTREFFKEFSKHVHEDYNRIIKRIQMGIQYLSEKNQNTTEPVGAALDKLITFLKNLSESATHPSNSTSDKESLKTTLVAIHRIFGKLPTLNTLRGKLCAFKRNLALMKMVGPVLRLTREKFIYNFRRTVEFVKEAVFKKMLHASGYPVVAQKLMNYLKGVISEESFKKLKELSLRYGPGIIMDRIRLRVSLYLRPKGTYSSFADFRPFLFNAIVFMKSLPKELQVFNVKEMVDKFDAKKLVALMRKPGKVFKMCMRLHKHLPKAIVEKLKAKKGFKKALKAVCATEARIDSWTSKEGHRRIAGIVEFGLRYLGVSTEAITAIKNALEPGTVHEVSDWAPNPALKYPELKSKEAGSELVTPALERVGKKFFPDVAGWVKHLVHVMYRTGFCG